jgi:hypothetical protein
MHDKLKQIVDTARLFDHMHVVVVPSLRDVQHDSVVPQPPFERHEASLGLQRPHGATGRSLNGGGALGERVHFVGNPCVKRGMGEGALGGAHTERN